MAFKKIYPGMLAALIGGIAAFLLLRLHLSIWQSSESNPPVPSPSPSVSVAPKTPPQPMPYQLAPVADGLRVSNQTTYPLRVVLSAGNSESNNRTEYRQPVHWDFAPNEGSQGGLILSLPDSNLKLHKGDILVAFALDGSRRYWGPYVVSGTALPIRSSQSGEWHLVLRP